MNCWPKKHETPISIFLEKQGYYKKYKKVWVDPTNSSLDSIFGTFSGGYIEMPIGMTSKELLTIYNSLSSEYKIIEGRA